MSTEPVTTREGGTWMRLRRWSSAVALLLVALGFGFRIAPMLDYGGRMLWQWPTEDGYLMMTVARNIALGHGMSVSGGEVPTNGTQPLATMIWAGIFWLTGGDRASGVVLIQSVQVALGAIGALLIFVLGRRLLGGDPRGQSASAVAAGLWFASPVVINHTMNGLETALYLVLVILSVLAWSRWHVQAAARIRIVSATAIGALFGLTFLARVDAVFLIAALTGWHCLLALREGGRIWVVRTAESFISGIASIVVASPWLIYSYAVFGSIMPISGTSQSSAAPLGYNLARVPSALLNYITQVLPIPIAVADEALVVGGATIVCLGFFAVLGLGLRHASRDTRIVALVVATTGLALVAYYGAFFGARHFVPRYLAPWSPFLTLAMVALVYAVLDRSGRTPAIRNVAWVGAHAAIIALVIGLNVRIFMEIGRGSAYGHIQVMRWVESNVSRETWVGAIQTGVLGFFHDRTVNLDGKVNPYALAARLERRTPQYILETPIEYLADWHGIASWIKLEPLDRHFELLVDDRQVNLAVLKRLSPVPAHADVRGGRRMVAPLRNP